jgi:single stranded DNA-binding protein
MASLEDLDRAWLAGEPVPVPEPEDPPRKNHPQVHALEHAAEQLRAARYWSHTDPGVAASYRQALDALAEEVRRHLETEAEDPGHNRPTAPKENIMAGETTITVIGNLTADPELRFTPSSGSAVANFTVASTPRTFDRQSNEWKDGETLFLRCSLWREAAENVAESLTKGTRVIVTGRLKSRSYETKEGEKRTVIELEAEEIGPSLRYASAKVNRTPRNGGQSMPPAAGDGGAANEDSWAMPAGQSQGWGQGTGYGESEPPF